MIRKSYILFFIFLFGFTLSLTNGFADEVPDPILEILTPEGGVLENIIGTPDFEKMRDLPPDSQDYILGRSVGMMYAPLLDNSDSVFLCTGFLVGPDLFMTSYRCLHDALDRLSVSLEGVLILMDYYQDLDVDMTYGYITARVSALLQADKDKGYALLRLDAPIGNTYGWLRFDTTTPVDSTQSVKIIQHPDGRSKEIVRRNTQIVDIPLGYPFFGIPFVVAFLADCESGSVCAPVFLREGSDVIAIVHSSVSSNNIPKYNTGLLMSHIVPDIQHYLPYPVIKSIANVSRTTGYSAFTIQVGFSAGTSPVTWSITGIVGASITNTGLISIPAGLTAGNYTATVTATNTAGSDTENFTLTVVEPLTFTPSAIADETFVVGTAIVPFILPFATGGTPPYTYTLAPLPEGLSFSATEQALRGTPTTVETTTVTYTATDAENVSVSLTFTIDVISDLDVNGDGQVTVIDLVMVALFYGTEVLDGGSLPADVNADGIVNILDLTAVAHGIDTQDGTDGLSLAEAEAALAAVEIEAIAEAPNALSGGNRAYHNVAAALADARLDKRIPETVLKALLHLLSESVAIPETTALLANYPNPFNPETWIPYQLATDAEVTITIHGINGQIVRKLALGHQAAGIYESRGRAAYWDGRNQIGESVASGVYFYTLTAGDFIATRQLLIAK